MELKFCYRHQQLRCEILLGSLRNDDGSYDGNGTTTALPFLGFTLRASRTRTSETAGNGNEVVAENQIRPIPDINQELTDNQVLAVEVTCTWEHSAVLKNCKWSKRKSPNVHVPNQLQFFESCLR